MYVVERENGDRARHAYDRWHQAFDTEIIHRPPVGPPKVIALCTWEEAQRLVELLNAR